MKRKHAGKRTMPRKRNCNAVGEKEEAFVDFVTRNAQPQPKPQPQPQVVQIQRDLSFNQFHGGDDPVEVEVEDDPEEDPYSNSASSSNESLVDRTIERLVGEYGQQDKLLNLKVDSLNKGGDLHISSLPASASSSLDILQSIPRYNKQELSAALEVRWKYIL